MLGHPARILLPIMAVLYALGFANLFLRSSFGVLAPGLAAEMAMSPALLSTVASAFFLAYALMQVPTGMLLDRFGPRRTLSVMLLFTLAGAGLFAAAHTPILLILARILMGIGCAGVFTGAFHVMMVWLPSDRVVTQIGAMNSFAALGTLTAATPLAILIAWIGWREAYWLFTAGVALLALAVAAGMRDGPAGMPPPASKQERLGQILAGVREAVRQPNMKRLAVAGVPLSAASTLSGVWAAPYLKDVHEAGDIGRGNVLLAMAVAGVAGHVLHGQLARRLNTLKGPIIGGGLVIAGIMTTLAGLERPPLWLVTALFTALGVASAYPTITYAHARGLLPGHLVGRGVAAVNMGIMLAIAGMQLAFGWIVGAFPAESGALPEIAYRTAFGVQAALVLAALAVYAPVRDIRPRG